MFPQIRSSVARAPTSAIPFWIFHRSRLFLLACIPDNQYILSTDVSPSLFSHTPTRLFKGWIARQFFFLHFQLKLSICPSFVVFFCSSCSFFCPLFSLTAAVALLSLHPTLMWVRIHLAAIRCLSTDPAQSSAKARNPFKWHNSWQRESDRYRWRSNGPNADNCD